MRPAELGNFPGFLCHDFSPANAGTKPTLIIILAPFCQNYQPHIADGAGGEVPLVLDVFADLPT